MNEEASLVMKSDTRARVRTPAAQREALLEEFGRSGLTAARFAAMVGVNYQTFCTWLQKRRRQEARRLSAGGQVPPFVEAISPQRPLAGLIVRLPGQASIEVGDARQVPLAVMLLRGLDKGGEPC